MTIMPESLQTEERCALCMMTVGTALRWAKETLASSGVPEPEADAQVLVAHVAGVDRLNLFLNTGRVLSLEEEKRLTDLIRERAGRKPFQYILGEQEFWSLPFKVTPDVLVPRPETETLVETVLNTLKSRNPCSSRLTILDLCTGSGILAVVLAREIPESDIYAVDLSKAALSVAMDNARRHGVSDAITFLQGDLFAPLAKRETLFDVIVSNPPYVPSDILGGLSPEVKDYEPHLALDGGPDGLDIVRKIISDSPAYLRIGGWLFLEIGDGQGKEVLKELEKAEIFKHISLVRDHCNVPRVIRAQRAN